MGMIEDRDLGARGISQQQDRFARNVAGSNRPPELDRLGSVVLPVHPIAKRQPRRVEDVRVSIARLLSLALGHSGMEHDAGDSGPMRTGQTTQDATHPHPEDNPPWHGHEQRSANRRNPDDKLHDASVHVSNSTLSLFYRLQERDAEERLPYHPGHVQKEEAQERRRDDRQRH